MPLNRTTSTVIAALVVATAGGGLYLAQRARPAEPAGAPAPASAPAAVVMPDVSAMLAELKAVLAAYRKIIVLLADERTLSAAARAPVNRVGHELFHANLARIAMLEERLNALVASGNPLRFEALATVLDFVESGPDMYDADRLAFREVLRTLRQAVARDSSLQAVKLHKRISEDLDALAEIERNYEKEIKQIFSRFDARAIVQKRERWEDYVAHLKKLYSREQVLKDHGVVLAYPAPKEPAAGARSEEAEIYGYKLAPKTVVLTFDDGPHHTYTDEIVAILKQYGAPAVFFAVGRNLGRLDGEQKPKLSANAAVSRKVKAAGFEIANHSFTHAQLSKQTGDTLKAEILSTDTLLKAVDLNRSPLFRFPYGARNSEGLQVLADANLKSVMWNVDSLDWADPVPSSIADRVLRSLDKEGRGIVLFHDIHERTVKALPIVLDRLVAEGYQFAGWDGTDFALAKGAVAPAERAIVTTGYSDSWAIVIGIDEYTKWPKLQYAVKDAAAVRQTLIERFGFAPERVISLANGEATRSNILAAFHDRLARGGVKKNDRVFVFFAGHGATRKLSSGRDLGYIVPVDSDPNQIAADAIPMTEIQNIAESLAAKHVLFVMDACYSGLGLTRGAGSGAFARENAKRIGRQMLTAGGADQLVADGGPNGHSIFTWTLLQALAGKADLNGDRLITATELAAYIAPAVAGVSQQTPAFGSLPGSEGGEFVFEVPGETEFLTAGSTQLSGEAIALNSKLEAARPQAPDAGPGQPPAMAAVMVRDLQGNERKLVTPAATGTSARQLAQRANDQGLQYYKEQRYAEAEAQFTEALKLRPDFALAANNLGFVYYKQEKYAEAVRWFENTIKADPSRSVAYANLGDALRKLGRTAEARVAYQRLVEIAPGSRSAAHAADKLRELGDAGVAATK